MSGTENMPHYSLLVKSQLMKENLQPLVYLTIIIPKNNLYTHWPLYPEIRVVYTHHQGNFSMQHMETITENTTEQKVVYLSPNGLI